MNFNELHDCIINNILIDWKNGIVRIDIETFKGKIVLECSGLSKIVIPHKFPWGKSDYINDTTIEISDCIKNLDIEMQSGDIISIEYNDHRWEV